MSKREGKIRILFVYANASPSTFVRRDLNMLKRHFNVKPMKATTFLVPRRGRSPLVFLRLLRGILWANVVYSWFVNLNSFFIVLFCMFLRKKCIIVVGGIEVAYVPQMNYGRMLKTRTAYSVKCVLSFAHKILAVSRFSRREILNYAAHEKVELLYNGIDCERFKPCSEKQDNLVLMVGPISKRTIKIHGLDTFIEAAKLLPKVKFLAIGLHKDAINSLSSSSPPNMTLMRVVSQKDLIPYYQRAKVYCQLSFRESFGVSLAEAMCCECVPVVTKNGGAMPEVVGNTGFYARFNDPENVAEMIMKALKSEKGKEARGRIVKYFSITKREMILVNLIQKMVTYYGKK